MNQTSAAGIQAIAASREPGKRILAGVELLVKSRYLQLIGLYVFLYTIGSTFLYLEQGRIVEEVELDSKRRTAIFASIDVYANVLTLFIQLFVTGQVLKWFGFRVALLIVPMLTFIAFAVLWYVDHAAALPAVASLYTIGIIQVLRRGSHYAIDRPAREALYTVLGADEKYKAKPIIDTFIYRSGDMVGAWLPRGLAAWSIALAPVALGTSALWIVVAAWLGLLAKARSSETQSSDAAAGSASG